MPLTGSLVPTQTNWDYNVVETTIEAATYQKMKLIPVVDEAMRLYNQLTIRKHARVTGVALADSADGTGLTYLNITGTPVTVVPVHSVVPVAWGPNFEAQHKSSKSLSQEAYSNVTDSLAEMTERNVMANFTAATNFLSDVSVTATMLRQGLARLFGNTNGNFGPGTDQNIYGFFSHTQLPPLQAIPEVNSAEMRGDSENPYVRGIWVKGFGFALNISSVIPNDVNGWHNALIVASALVTSWNMRTKLTSYNVELAEASVAENNMGSNVKHDARMFVLRTTADAS